MAQEIKDYLSEVGLITKELPVFNVINILGRDFTIYGCERNPLFLARDVAEVIDYAKTGKGAYDISRMLGTVPDCEKLLRTIFVSGTNGKGQRRRVWMLTENGLYTVLMQSRKPLAVQFQEEVKKILWTLRREGIYASPSTISYYLNEPDDLELLVDEFKLIEDERNYYKNQVEQMKDKAQYCDDILRYSGRTYTMRDICEQLHISVSYKEMYKKLIENKLMYKVGNQNYFTFPMGREKFTATVTYKKVNPTTGKVMVINKKRWTEAGKHWIWGLALSWRLTSEKPQS